MHIALKITIILIASYLLGNISFARIWASTRKDDITKHGSGNPGTMNMLRTHGVWLAVLTLLFDAIKCVIPCLVAKLWLFAGDAYLEELGVHLAGLGCIVGHMYPVVYKFKGGKSIASGFGFAMISNPIVGGACALVFGVSFGIFKTGSLSSLLALFVFGITNTVLLAIDGYYMCIALLWVMVLLITYAHRSNIKRLLCNKESKISLQEAIEKDKAYSKAMREKKKNKNKPTTQTSESAEQTNSDQG